MTTAPSTDDRDAYASFLAASPQRSVFAEPWWLDAASGAPDAWQANLLRGDAGQVEAAWPLVTSTHRLGAVGTGAPYTPFLGPLLPSRGSSPVVTSAQVALLDRLGARLAAHAHVEAACMPELDYWTPLAWHGFAQTTRTTWRIAAGTDPDAARAAMHTGRRRNLTAAERAGLTIGDGSVDELLAACESTFAQQGAAVPGRATLERLARAAVAAGRADLLAVRTPDGELASAGLFVHDDRWTWNLANGRMELGDAAKGAPTLLMWGAIRRALLRGTGFDFEGSMLRPVERFVREFGGTPAPYSVVRRSSPQWERRVARRRLVRRLTRSVRR